VHRSAREKPLVLSYFFNHQLSDDMTCSYAFVAHGVDACLAMRAIIGSQPYSDDVS
jgi:hypothetical protein